MKATVTLDEDLDTENNESEAIINCKAADVLTPQNLTSEKVDANKLKLSGTLLIQRLNK